MTRNSHLDGFHQIIVTDNSPFYDHFYIHQSNPNLCILNGHKIIRLFVKKKPRYKYLKKLNIKFREPNEIMKLSRLGSFHQSKLSFLRSFIREFKDWDYKRDLFNLDVNGFGTAVYSFKKIHQVFPVFHNYRLSTNQSFLI